MEIELKYLLTKEQAEAIWNDKDIMSLEEKDSRETIQMKAVYFDTEDMVLAKNRIAFRVRTEGDRVVATLKKKGQAKGALHERQEVNVPLDDAACLIKANPNVFSESEDGKDLLDILKGKELLPVLEMAVQRKRSRLEYESCLIEMSIDQGKIITENGESPILEIEFELFLGEKEKLNEFGEKIAKKYDLLPGNHSKYSRGLALLGKNAI